MALTILPNLHHVLRLYLREAREKETEGILPEDARYVVA